MNLSDGVGTCQNQMTWYDNASEGCNVSSTETNHKSMFYILDLCICLKSVKYCKKKKM